MLGIEKEYLVQVNDGDQWVSIDVIIPVDLVKTKNDIFFFVNEKQVSMLSEYKGKPIRLVKPKIKNNDFVNFEVLSFGVWNFYKENQVICLNPNRNFRTYTAGKNEVNF